MKFIIRFSRFVYLIPLMLFSSAVVTAQEQSSPASIKCGEILDTEMVAGIPYQDTVLAVQAGTKIDLTTMPLGSTFNPFIFLIDSGGGEITRLNTNAAGIAEELISFQLGSSNSVLRVMGAPQGYVDTVPKKTLTSFMGYFEQDAKRTDNYYREKNLDSVGIFYGAYTISLGCTLRDGIVIKPGDTANTTTPNIDAQIVFSGTGFPGLAPVDFANAFTNELMPGQPAKSKIPSSGDAVLGYTIDAAANDILALEFTRASGNLNLGLVVLSSDNKVVFQASLVTSSELTTKFTLPSAGTYTIGIFRIDLLPPAAPEATAFQLTATLNP